MPYTNDIDDRFAVTVQFDSRDRSGYRASAAAFRCDTGGDDGITHYGEGATLDVAEKRAFAAARGAAVEWARP